VPERALALAPFRLVAAVVLMAVVGYFMYMIHRIAASLHAIARGLEQLRLDRVARQ